MSDTEQQNGRGYIYVEMSLRDWDGFKTYTALSAPAVRASRELHRERPVVVALTGTDLYRDIHRDRAAQESLELADLLIVLHPGGAAELPATGTGLDWACVGVEVSATRASDRPAGTCTDDGANTWVQPG